MHDIPHSRENFHCGHGYMHGSPLGAIFGPEFFHAFKNIKEQLCSFYPYSLKETETDYIITMPLPGHEPSDVEVSVKGNEIYIETKKPEQVEEQGQASEPGTSEQKVLCSMGEFIWNKPEVSVRVPIEGPVDENTIKAKLSKGILTVTFQKPPARPVHVDEN